MRKNFGDNELGARPQIESDTGPPRIVDELRRRRLGYLTGTAPKLWLWITQSVEPSKDYVVLDCRRYMAENNIRSTSTYQAAKNQLLQKQLLFPTLVRGVYWVNPNYLKV